MNNNQDNEQEFDGDREQTANEVAFTRMNRAFDDLKNDESGGSREKSLVMTKLEEAMMWLNKHRAMVGEFEENPTHIE